MLKKRGQRVIVLLMALAILIIPNVTFAGSGGGQPSGADNIVPAGLIKADNHRSEQDNSLKRKLDHLNKTKPADITIQAVTLSMSGVTQHPCGAYCGQAATQEIFHYKGQWSYTLDNIRSWENPGNVGCSNGAGTCLLPIRDTLNSGRISLPFSGFYVGWRVNHTSLTNAAYDLEAKTKEDINSYSMPLMALTNPNPPDGTPYCLPGWCGVAVSGHYLTINGYNGTYNGSDASGAIYYLDSWYNPSDQHWANTNNFADSIYYKDGIGSCTSQQYDLIW